MTRSDYNNAIRMNAAFELRRTHQRAQHFPEKNGERQVPKNLRHPAASHPSGIALFRTLLRSFAPFRA